MDQARAVSKKIEDALLHAFSRGLLVPHRFASEGDVFWSWPDVEAIIAPTNAFQDEEYLRDFISQYRDYTYTVGGMERHIQGAKITWPHMMRDSHNIPPPHPSMTDERLLQYLWPGSSMTMNYCATLWVDVGTEDVIIGPQIQTGEHSSRTIYRENWRKILQIPIQVGSNRCNLAVMRSYLDDPEWGTRARQFLEDVIHWESYIPDGYFIINGRLKRINISDKLMMNMAYVVRIATAKDFGDVKFTPVRGRVCEVRSVNPSLGLSYFQLFLLPPSARDLPVPRGVNADIFRFYNSPISVAIDREFSSPVNLFDLVRGYGVIVMEHESTKQAMDDLMAQIRLMSNSDAEVLRAAMITRSMAGDLTRDGIISDYRSKLNITHSSLENRDDGELILRLRRKVLPHCENEKDQEGSYWAKLRFMAMMVLDLMMSVTYKPGTTEPRKEATDRKHFAFKRWETAGHGIKDYVRMMLLPRISGVENGVPTYKTTALDQLERHDNKLLTYMQMNQWPSKFRSGGVFPGRKEDHKDGVVEDVPLHNVMAMVDSYRTVKIGAKGGPNTGASRRVHTSQWGFQCPVNTPENANIGLNNNLAEVALISSELSAGEKESLDEVLDKIVPVPENDDDAHLLMVDGCPEKWVASHVFWDLREARRMGFINRGIGLAMHHQKGIRVIVVRTTHGRPLLPLLSLMPTFPGESREARLEAILDVGGAEDTSLDTLMEQGIVEFVDGYELSMNVVVAGWLAKVMDGSRLEEYTHIMIKPGHTLSQATNCLPFLEHNPAPRGTYATQHIKQAIGRPFLHPELRMDHGANYLEVPEMPLLMTDTLRRLLNPEYHVGERVDPRAVGYGRNLNIACLSLDGNNDDGIHISQDVVDSGIMDGQHYSILSSDRNILVTSSDAYDWVVDPDSGKEIVSGGQGLIDPEFSGSVIVPYGDPYIVEVDPQQDRTPTWVNMKALGLDNLYTYQLSPGELYIPYGRRKRLMVTYRDTTTKMVEEKEVIIGKDQLHLPGKVIESKRVLKKDGKSSMVHRYALAFIHRDKAHPLKALHNERDQFLTLQQLKDGGANDPIDIRFLDQTPAFTVDPEAPIHQVLESGEWYGMGSVPIPKTQGPDGGYVRQGKPAAIRPRRKVKRGDVGIRILRKDQAGTVVDEEKQRFEITYGVIDDIKRGSIIEIRGLMPLFPKPGNKYAALHAQKSVCARIVPKNEMPKGRWFNPVLKIWEEFIPDIAFNPLSFPSRMTIGMVYEIIFTGTIKYIWDQKVPGDESRTMGTLFSEDPDGFEDMMVELYGPSPAMDSWVSLLEEIRDITTFMFNDEEKLKVVEKVREMIGMPVDGLYNLYLPKEGVRPLPDEVLQFLPSHDGWESKIENPIFCGTIYYVALRHLVDNKRRARGYVGKRDPLTLQPVKGRKRNGGATTGVMESDAYKAHGAAGLLYERMAMVSDRKFLLKCPDCGGLVVKNDTTGSYQCIDCSKEISSANASQIIEHETVNSWQLFSTYVRALGINITETFA